MEERVARLEKTVQVLSDQQESNREKVLEVVKVQLEEWLHDTLTISCLTEEIDRRYRRNKSDMAEQTRENRRIYKQIEDTNEQIRMNFTDLCKMKNFIDDILTDLKLKAYTGDVKRIERLLEEKCSWEYAKDLSERLKNFVVKEELQNFQIEFIAYKKQSADSFQLKEDALSLFKNSERKVKALLNDYPTREELRASVNKPNKRIAAIEAEFESVKKGEELRQETLRYDVKKLRTDFHDVVRQIQLDKLQAEVNQKASKADFDRFVADNLPKINEFWLEAKSINSTINMQEVAIGRLDEILLQKASKTDLMVMKESFSDLPLAAQLVAIKKVYEKAADIQTQVDKNTEMIDEVYKFYSENNPNRLSVDTELKLIKCSLLEFENTLSYKADTSEILETIEKKANLDDFRHLFECIESINLQMKILASQIAFQSPQKKNQRASSHRKLTKKQGDLTLDSKPAPDYPSFFQLRTFVKSPTIPESIKTRVGTPQKRLLHTIGSLVNV